MSSPHHSQSYAPDQPPPAPAPRRSNGLAVTALVLGILACVLFWTVIGGIVLGVLALVFGVVGARNARKLPAPGRSTAIVGAVLGTLALVVSGVLLAIGAWIFNSEEFDNYEDCMRHAETRDAEAECAEDFSEDIRD